jgi:hypothetical protein
MASDLNDFFAKKASKSKKKNKVLDVGTLGQKLDRTIQLQEEREQREAQGPNTDELSQGGDTDSEWIDPTANDITTNLEELGIKDMALSSYADEEESDHEKVEIAPVRTWGTARKEDTSEAESTTPATVINAPAQPKKYVAPGSRGGSGTTTRGGAMKIDINNTEAFPSLADADVKVKEQQKAKAEEAKTAKDEGYQTVGQQRSRPYQASTQPTPPPVAADSIFAKKSASAYKPPGARGESNIVASNPRPAPIERQPTPSKPQTPEKSSSAYKPPGARGESNIVASNPTPAAPTPEKSAAPPAEEKKPEEPKPGKYVPPWKRQG